MQHRLKLEPLNNTNKLAPPADHAFEHDREINLFTSLEIKSLGISSDRWPAQPITGRHSAAGGGGSVDGDVSVWLGTSNQPGHL